MQPEFWFVRSSGLTACPDARGAVPPNRARTSTLGHRFESGRLTRRVNYRLASQELWIDRPPSSAIYLAEDDVAADSPATSRVAVHVVIQAILVAAIEQPIYQHAHSPRTVRHPGSEFQGPQAPRNPRRSHSGFVGELGLTGQDRELLPLSTRLRWPRSGLSGQRAVGGRKPCVPH
jgi:hypothetical protein